MKTLLLIDGHNMLFKAFGVPYTFYSASHTPLHVVTTFLGLVRRSIGYLPQDSGMYVAIVFDTQTKTDNHALLDQYKANRKNWSEEKDSPFIHLPYICDALDYLNIRHIEKEYVEADDVIATLAKRFLDEFSGEKVYVVSTDTDFYQIVQERVHIIKHLPRGKTITIDPHTVHELVGVPVEEYVLYKAMVGDSADNVPGVPGIGPVRARKILTKEMLFDLSKYTDLLARNKQLITLNQYVPLDIIFDTCKLPSQLFTVSNAQIFRECNF